MHYSWNYIFSCLSRYVFGLCILLETIFFHYEFSLKLYHLYMNFPWSYSLMHSPWNFIFTLCIFLEIIFFLYAFSLKRCPLFSMSFLSWLTLSADRQAWRRTVHQIVSTCEDSVRVNLKQKRRGLKDWETSAAIQNQTFVTVAAIGH